MNLRRRYVKCVFGFFCTIALAACSKEAAKFNATDITGAPFAKSLSLADHDGKPRVLADFKGKLIIVSFGFTYCPDYCPATLALWAEALKRLGDDAKHVQGLFITVDPERDTPELLSKYVPAFHPTFLGLRGDDAQTKAAAAEFKIVYQKAKGTMPQTYTVDHSTQSYIFDAQGNVRLMAAHGMDVDKLVSDLRVLLKQR
jgi:protein SCO1